MLLKSNTACLLASQSAKTNLTIRNLISKNILSCNFGPIGTRNTVLLTTVTIPIQTNTTIGIPGTSPFELGTGAVGDGFTPLISIAFIDILGIAVKEEPVGLNGVRQEKKSSGQGNDGNFHGELNRFESIKVQK